MITYERLHEILRYEPETGKWFWMVRMGKKVLAGSETGKPDVTGYCHIRMGKNLYKSHRLAWFYMTGQWPSCDIDHINRNPSDNRWENLREATKTQNMANCRVRKHSASGIKGVRRNPLSKKESWIAEIRHKRKKIHIGCFPTAAEAQSAYWAKAQEIYGEFANSG